MQSTPTIKYNPAFLTEEELIRAFVVRQNDLGLILEAIRESEDNSNQHILVVAPRGAGKTTLALRTAAEIRREKEYSNNWYPIIFSEESYKVCSPGEFWLEAIFHISEQVRNGRWKMAYEDLLKENSEERLRERALSQLMDFADQRKKRLLLVVENLNMLLGQQISMNDSWKLRHTLMNEPRIMLLGTATTRFDQIDNSENAMFELFKIHDLKPLDTGECRKLWESITGEKSNLERIRPIQILTGGSPRLLVIISSFAARTSFSELMKDLTGLVDEHTEYFKSHLDNLPAQERKVFATLADIWYPATAREIAEAARIDVNKASAHLQRLISKGAVVVVDQKGRKKWYQIAERMYNIYHLMRRRGEPSSRVLAVVDFMVHFYIDEDLVHLTKNVAAEACRLAPHLCTDHIQLIEEILKRPQSERFREKIIENIPEHIIKSLDLTEVVDKAMPVDESKVEIQKKELTKEEIESGVLENPQDPRALSMLALELLNNHPDRFEEVKAACQKAISIDFDYAPAWFVFSQLLRDKIEDFEAAEKAYMRVLEIDPENIPAWGNLGILLFRLERYEEAEEAYRRAIEIDPENVLALASLGMTLAALERYEEAEEAYRRASKLDPEDVLSLGGHGRLLHYLKRYEEAEDAYRRAIEIDPENVIALHSLGDLLYYEFERYEEAEKIYRRVIALDSDNVSVWVEFGNMLNYKLERYGEAEAAYRRAIEIDPENVPAWGNLGNLLYYEQCYEEAEKAYRRVVEIDPEFIEAWMDLADLLEHELERYEEAEKAYRRIVEIDPKNVTAFVNLGHLLYCKLERYEEAEKISKRAIEIDPKDASAWNNLGNLLTKDRNRYDEAERAYKQAIELEPNEYYSLMNLIQFQFETLKKSQRAIKTAEQFLKISGRSAQNLNILAWLFFENGYNKYFEQAEAWSKEAVKKDSDVPEYQHTHAALMGGLGKWEESLKIARNFLNDKDFVKSELKEITNYFITAASAGHADKAIRILEQHPEIQVLEPVVVGMKIFIGEEFRTAQEIKEIGQDVAERIRERMNTENR